MKDLIDKFISIEKELSEEAGDFELFALFLREDSPNKWDLLVSANWIDQDKSHALKIVSNKVQEHLEKKELVNLSRIVVIKDDNPALEAFHQAVSVEHGYTEIQNATFFGLEIKHAIVITSRSNTAKAS